MRTLEDALHESLSDAEADLIEASHGDDFDTLLNARSRYVLVSVMHEAATLESGGAEWSDGPEARAYLAALRKIVAHLEAAVVGPDSSGAPLLTIAAGTQDAPRTEDENTDNPQRKAVMTPEGRLEGR